MRLVSVICLLAMVAITASVALAGPNGAEPKEWHLNLDVRAVYPEAEPNDTCPGQQMACGDEINPAYLDAGNFDWYQWTMNAGDQLTVGTDVVNAGDNTDTFIELYASDCTTMLASDDDSGPGFYSLISDYIAPTTGTYNLKVRGYGTSSSGPYKLVLACQTPPPPPANDTCDGAIVLERCTAGTVSGNTANGYFNNYDPGIPGPSCTGFSAAGKDEVYAVNLNEGDIVQMTYTMDAVDASFYLVTDCADVSASCVAGADQGYNVESIYYTVPAGGTGMYWIILDAYGTNAAGPWTLDYNFQCPVPPEPRACCFDDGHCEMQLAADCYSLGGHPQAEDSTCEPNPCEVVPTTPSSWGQIKGMYR